MTIKTLLLLAVLAGAVAGCLPFGSGAPYDRSDMYKNSNGTEQMGAPGSNQRD